MKYLAFMLLFGTLASCGGGEKLNPDPSAQSSNQTVTATPAEQALAVSLTPDNI
jgi:hypothetical protein